jgi:hypothetical protein
VNLECPLLAIRRHCVVHLLDFPPYAERLLAQPSARPLPIDRARLGVGLCSQSRPARCCEHAGTTGLTKQLPSSLVTFPEWSLFLSFFGLFWRAQVMVSHLERLLPTRPSARWHFRNACLKLAKRAARTRIDVPCRNSLRVPKSYDHSCIAAWRWI